tara:strand:- start:2271 stop:4151 length:1881 start_codon:yes stop_codon:yes gene_type:complete
MARRATVYSLKVFLYFLILMIIFSYNVTASDNEFTISDSNTWSIEYLDGSTLEKTGNNSASDGDFVDLKIQVFNSNLSSDNSSWSFSFGYGGQWYGGHSGILNGASSATDVVISFGPVSEGYILCKLQVDNTQEIEILEIRVGPNPVNFSSAGSEEIVIIGQPVHVGDELTASILVHNKGSNSDSVRLELTKDDGTTLVNGDFIVISPGSSREVSANFIPLLSGSLVIDWRVSSLNGGVDISLNGSSNIEVRESQDINVELDEITWTFQDGINLDVSIYLSSGLNRSVDLEVLMKSGNEYTEYQTFPLQINPGIRNINLKLGHPDASRLKVIVSPNDWLPLNGDGEVIIELIPPLVIPSIIISEASPSPISVGESFSIEYTLENTGASETPPGLLRIVDVAQPPLVFAEISIPSISSGGTYSDLVEFSSWEYSQTTNIEFIWTMGDISVSNQTSVLVESGTSTSFSLPFSIYAAVYGALSGLAIVMTCLVIYRVISQRTPSTESTLFRSNFLNRVPSNNNSESKKEVSCPSCSQRLHIPIDHLGSVKCPACSMQFAQNNLIQSETTDKEEMDESEDEVIVSELEASSLTDLLACPQCEQTLRVALDKRPVRSRCPACRVEFIAKIG